MGKEEYIFKLSMLEQRSKEMEQQISLIDQQIFEMQSLKLSLEKMDKAEEILSPLGKGIFAKTKLLEKEFFVNVGAGVVLKKNGKETSDIIEKQTDELAEIRENFLHEISKINFEIERIIEEVQAS